MSNTPPVPRGLVKPKHNSLIHSPPTPPRAKHIHMSHTPPTPLTSTSPVLDKTPEPRVPLIHALTATTPHPNPTPALPSPSHPHNLTAHTHATQTTVHASQSPQQPHAQHRVLRQPHKQTKDYHRTTSTTQTHRPSSKSERNIIILQVNINGLRNKLEELKLLIHDTHADIITIQETKLTPKAKTPKIHNITTVSNTLYNRTSWTTQHALSSDHLPIITTINIRHDYRLQQNRRTFTNYKKADWTQFTEDTESAFARTTIPTNIHTANIIITSIILMADKQNIPKGKMHSNCRLLPEDIVYKITQRNNIRRANTCDPALKLLNEEITSDIQKHKQNIWKEHLDAHWDLRHNTHTLWKTIHGLSNIAPPHTLNTSITFNNKIATTPTHIANCFTKQFTNTVKHATHKSNRPINRATHNIQGYNITLTTSQVQEAIKQIKNNNSQGPDKLNSRHLKHIGPLGLAFLTSMFKTALNKNIIPHTWKLANIVPIPKPNKDTDKGTSYRPISLLSVIAKALEKSLLPYITANIPNTPMQHGYKTQHSTVTALHTRNNTVVKGLNQMAPCANNHCSTRYEQSFRHNKHTHTNQKAATYKHSRHNH